MFGLKLRSKLDTKISQIHSLLARSFTNVKRDTTNLFQWTNYLYQRALAQENMIKRLELELSHIPKHPEDIKRIIDSYYSYETLLERIKALDKKIDTSLPQKEKVIVEKAPVAEIEKRLEKLEQQKKESLREKVVKRLTRNSKEYVKNLILSYIRKYAQIGALQLKDMVVDEQGLCSKSSFYRVLGEIEALEEINVIRQGKEKYFFYKLSKQL